MKLHDPDYPDVDPKTGDEAETEELLEEKKKHLQEDRIGFCRLHDWIME